MAISGQPALNYVQSYAQWGLALLLGVAKVYEIVKPVRGHDAVTKAFLWTMAETSEELAWDDTWQLASEAMRIAQEYPHDSEMQRRCFQFLGARLSEFGLSQRRCSAAECVPLLVRGLTAWLGEQSQKGVEAAEGAAKALSRICTGDGCLDPAKTNPEAIERLRQIEEDPTRPLSASILRSAQSNAKESFQWRLLTLLATTRGFPGLVGVLSACYPGTGTEVGYDIGDTWRAPLMERTLQEIEGLPTIYPREAAEAMHPVAAVVLQGMQSQEADDARRLELSVKVLSRSVHDRCWFCRSLFVPFFPRRHARVPR